MLISLVKNIVRVRPDFRLILMSATTNAAFLQNYFVRHGFQLPSRISVPGKCFPVHNHFAEDILPKLQSSGFARHEVKSYFSNLPSLTFDRPAGSDTPILEAIIAYICKTQPQGAILVFLPSWLDIAQLKEKLIEDTFKIGINNESKYRIYTLHSKIPLSEQEDVFASFNGRKIILSTNIAETSVTVSSLSNFATLIF